MTDGFASQNNYYSNGVGILILCACQIQLTIQKENHRKTTSTVFTLNLMSDTPGKP